jgi:hypothetical protein
MFKAMTLATQPANVEKMLIRIPIVMVSVRFAFDAAFSAVIGTHEQPAFYGAIYHPASFVFSKSFWVISSFKDDTLMQRWVSGVSISAMGAEVFGILFPPSSVKLSKSVLVFLLIFP